MRQHFLQVLFSVLGLCLVLEILLVTRNASFHESRRCLNHLCGAFGKGKDVEYSFSSDIVSKGLRMVTKDDQQREETLDGISRNITDNGIKQLSENRTKSKEEEHASGARGKQRRKLVIILAQGRSGSSFFAELFNRDKNSFYLFEPLLVVERSNKVIHFELRNQSLLRSFKNESRELFKGLITCQENTQLAKYMDIYDEYGSRSRTAAFGRPPFTDEKRAYRIDHNKILKLCSNLTSYTVFKELEFRLPDMKLAMLVELSEELGVDLRVVQLVRDPRAYLHSQLKLGWFFKNTTIRTRRADVYMKSRCLETLRYVNDIEKNMKRYKSKMRYTLLRYEDLLTKSDSMLQKVTDVTGINVFNNSIGWFRQITKGTGKGDGNRYQNGPRNAALIKDSWRQNIDVKIFETIQRVCNKTMARLGYVHIHKNFLKNKSIASTGDFLPLDL
ncbi:carbohydrate sulfotransferase 5-like [Rhopilema esculentum]|uniref:carbohydrate sulfotransferase 5-like n=1 Tax=Rhopilema esculentum TaxID=499914 RepID=UPI0031DE642C|eukprot:gene6017-11387_t